MTTTAMPMDPRMERNRRERDRASAMSASMSSTSLATATMRHAMEVPAGSAVGVSTANH